MTTRFARAGILLAVLAPLVAPAENLLSPGDAILGGRVNGANFEVGVAGTVAGLNNWPAGEPPTAAINGEGQKYLNFAELNAGILVTPAPGASTATAMKLWTANDAVDRDPASYELYGIDAVLGPGPFPLANFNLISSGPLALPASRNLGGTAPLDDLNSQQVDFPANDQTYSSYLIVFPTVKDPGAANSMQIAEIQLIGNFGPGSDTDGDGLSNVYELANDLDPNDNGLNPNNNGVPGNPDNGAQGDPDGDTLTNIQERDLGTDPQVADTDGDGYADNVEDDTGVWTSSSATGSSPLDPDSDDDTLIDGVENPDLPYDPANPTTQPGTDPNVADTDGDGIKDAAELAAGRDPTVANPLPPALFTPGDPVLGGRILNAAFEIGIVGAEGAANAWPAAEAPEYAIDGVGQKYLNFGELSTGVLVTPSLGATIATNLVVWAANDAVPRDPASYEIYGSNDALTGAGPFPIADFTLISAGELSLPSSRNPGGLAPLEPANSETILFSNSASFTSYLIVFPTVDDTGAANSMQIAEVQLLGTVGGVNPLALNIEGSGANLVFSFDSRAGKLYDILSSTNPVAEQDPSAWAVWQPDLAADPPRNVETFARPADPERYFVVLEKDAPPLYFDDFESGQGAWTAGVSDAFGNTTWQLGTPAGSTGPIAGAGGSPNAFSTNLGDYGADSDIFLRSPVIDLNADGATGARLEFAQYRDADGFADSGEIRILRSSDFVQLGGTIDPDLTALDVDWTSFSASLPPEALGEMIVIEFRFLSDASADTFSGWSLDNVAVKLE